MEQSVIEIKNLVKRYKDLLALDHLNMEVRQGEVFGLLGPNGSGKTTAINCILGLLSYDKGEIRVFGKPMERGLWKRLSSLWNWKNFGSFTRQNFPEAC